MASIRKEVIIDAHPDKMMQQGITTIKQTLEA